jgi:hypothetical protein
MGTVAMKVRFMAGGVDPIAMTVRADVLTRFSSFYRLTASHFAELKDLLNSLPHTRPLGI